MSSPADDRSTKCSAGMGGTRGGSSDTTAVGGVTDDGSSAAADSTGLLLLLKIERLKGLLPAAADLSTAAFRLGKFISKLGGEAGAGGGEGSFVTAAAFFLAGGGAFRAGTSGSGAVAVLAAAFRLVGGSASSFSTVGFLCLGKSISGSGEGGEDNEADSGTLAAALNPPRRVYLRAGGGVGLEQRL